MGDVGRDTMEGGDGDDFLHGRDGTQFNDRLDGEAGTNRCATDPDFAVNCEVQWEKQEIDLMKAAATTYYKCSFLAAAWRLLWW